MDIWVVTVGHNDEGEKLRAFSRKADAQAVMDRLCEYFQQRLRHVYVRIEVIDEGVSRLVFSDDGGFDRYDKAAMTRLTVEESVSPNDPFTAAERNVSCNDTDELDLD